jgi:outer membrane protein
MVRYIRTSGLLVLAAAITIAPVAPVYAQNAQSPQQQQSAQSTATQQNPPQQSDQTGQQQNQMTMPQSTVTVKQPGPPPAPAAPKALSDTGKRQYSYGRRWFPDVIAPYTQLSVPMPDLVNTPDVAGFIKDGKLALSLQDCIALALKNNMDIQVQQYNPWIAETSILRGRAIGSLTSFDPLYTLTTGVNITNSPIVNPFLSGTTGGLSAITGHTFFVDNSYQQSFSTGTSLQVTMNGSRQASTAANLFNPSVQDSLNVGVSQQLLRGFGKSYNDKPLYIAEVNKSISDAAFKQSVLTDITGVEIDYWELVYARENVEVGEEVLAAAQKLLSDDQKQVQIGTMAPLDVTSAESGVASARQTLILDQTTLRQDELLLLSVITKNPMAPVNVAGRQVDLSSLEIVPTDGMFVPDITENIPLDQAMKEAIANRPDYQEFLLALKGDAVSIKAAKNELLPELLLSGQYGWSGLAGVQTISGAAVPGTFNAELNEPIVNANGTVIANEFIGVPVTLPPTTASSGLGTALTDLFTNKFPNYGATLTFQLPIRNRAAQADSISAILTQRQDLEKLQQEENNVVVDVRNTMIILEQDRAALEAAQAAVKYAQDAVDAEEKKLQFGTSTSLAVVQLQQTLALNAQQLVRSEANLVEAKVQFDRAMARTFAVNNINIQSAHNQAPVNPLIPGTMKNGQLYSAPTIAENPQPANGTALAQSNATAQPVSQAAPNAATPATNAVPKNPNQNQNPNQN